MWFVKGYIAQEKGIDINWAKVITFTAKEKLRREEIVKWKLLHGVASKVVMRWHKEFRFSYNWWQCRHSRLEDSKTRAPQWEDLYWHHLQMSLHSHTHYSGSCLRIAWSFEWNLVPVKMKSWILGVVEGEMWSKSD